MNEPLRNPWILAVIAVISGAIGGAVATDTPKLPQFDANAIEERLNGLQRQITDVHLKTSVLASEYAYLNPAEDTFSTAKTPYGALLVKITGVEAYGNGYKVTFAVGNILAMNISDVKLEAQWGRKMGENETYDDWKRTLKSTSGTIMGYIAPGTWATKTLTLAPAKQEDIEFIKLRLNVDGSKVRLL